MNKSPCKECPNRHIGCHETCQDYITYKKQIETINKQRRSSLYFRDYILERNK